MKANLAARQVAVYLSLNFETREDGQMTGLVPMPLLSFSGFFRRFPDLLPRTVVWLIAWRWLLDRWPDWVERISLEATMVWLCCRALAWSIAGGWIAGEGKPVFI